MRKINLSNDTKRDAEVKDGSIEIKVSKDNEKG